jgi:hypothetical protein
MRSGYFFILLFGCNIGRKDTNTITVNLPASVTYQYDLNGSMVIQERDGNNTPRISYTRGKDLN